MDVFFFRSEVVKTEKKFFNLTWKFLAFSKSVTLLNLFFHPLLKLILVIVRRIEKVLGLHF